MRNTMDMNSRIKLCNYSNPAIFEEFEICGLVDKGASIVCYEVKSYDKGNGILKEFYPKKNEINLMRTINNQLVFETGPYKSFENDFNSRLAGYLEPLKVIKEHNYNSGKLEPFISYFEIYKGVDFPNEKSVSYYVWTPYRKLLTYSEIISNIQSNTENKPEYNLYLILHSLRQLAKSVCELHKLGLLHCDLKPANFGFNMMNDEIQVNSLKIFDVDSIIEVMNPYRRCKYTPEYAEDEIKNSPPTNKTDIYSMGLILLYSLIPMSSFESGSFNQKKDYKNINKIIKSSKLITSSRHNSHAMLIKNIQVILEKCLAPRRTRYEMCEELIDDLDAALYYILPPEVTKGSRNHKQWILVDVDKKFDNQTRKRFDYAIKKHLYEFPLYEFMERKDVLNICVLGFGFIGQKFLDFALQYAQMKDVQLNVTVITKSSDKKTLYLSQRPALFEFFNAGQQGVGGNYGNINFLIDNLNELSSISKIEKINPDYTLIALGNDNQNMLIAEKIENIIGKKRTKSINVVIENKDNHQNIKYNNLYINDKVSESKRLNQMAFNVHLLWEKNTNISFKSVKNDFRKIYNYNSCISNVIATKYKLYSIGLNMDDDAVHVASKFSDLIANSPDIIDILAWLEHKRWVTEKICSGWRNFQRLEDCLSVGPKDEKSKRHVCIVRSEPNQLLREDYRSKDKIEVWDSNHLPCSYDELDTMSVQLHRIYKSEADNVKKIKNIKAEWYNEITKLIEDDIFAFRPFKEWFSCALAIWNGDYERIKVYKSLKDRFLESIRNYKGDEKKRIIELFEYFNSYFSIVLKSCEYRDYKLDDVVMIENIPFVLTYKNNYKLIVPYYNTPNSEKIKNVAAMTVINPQNVLFLSIIKDKEELQELKHDATSIMKYVETKKLRAMMSWLVLLPKSIENLENDIVKYSSLKFESIIYHGDEELCQCLNQIQKKYSDYIVEINEGFTSTKFVDVVKENELASFSYNSSLKSFLNLKNCTYLKYITLNRDLSISEVNLFHKNVKSEERNYDYFDIHEEVWHEYLKDSEAWDYVLGKIKNYCKERDLIAKFEKNTKVQEKSIKFILPSATKYVVKKIIGALIEAEIIDLRSTIEFYNSDSIVLEIYDRYNNEKIFNNLFSNPMLLYLNSEVTVVNEKIGTLIYFNNLQVTNFLLEKKYHVLTTLARYNLIFNVNFNQDTNFCDFTFSTSRVKTLISSGNELFIMHLLHLLRNYGNKDFICRVSYFKNENAEDVYFDFLLIKEFKMLFITFVGADSNMSDFELKQRYLEKSNGSAIHAVICVSNEMRDALTLYQSNRTILIDGNCTSKELYSEITKVM